MGIFSALGGAVGTYFAPGVGTAVGSGIGGMVDSAIEGNASANQASDAFNQNARLQKEFAQNGIQWKVEDAKRAGIHPLAALGAQTASFSPVSVGGVDYSTFNDRMGQDISRAVAATRPQAQRAADLIQERQNLELNQITLDRARAGLQNDLLNNQILSSQIGRLNSAQIGPGMPNSSATRSQVVPARVTASQISDKSVTAGPAAPAWTKYNIGTDRSPYVVELPGQSIDQALDGLSTLPGMYYKAVRNTIFAKEWLQDRFDSAKRGSAGRPRGPFYGGK